MTIDLLEAAHSRAYAPQSQVTLPTPVSGPFLVFEPPATVTLRGRAQRTELGVKNVGDDTCVVREISAGPGVIVEDAARAGKLGPGVRTWLRLAIQVDPFRLTERQGSVPIRFEVQPFRRFEVLVFETAVPFVQGPNEAASVIVAEQTISFTAVVNGLRLFSVDASGAREVTLAIVDGPNGRERYVMHRAGTGTSFQVAFPVVEGGRYAYQFVVDGTSRLDDRVLDHSVLPDGGSCSAIEIEHANRTVLHLRNPSDGDLEVSAEATEQWLHVDGPIRLSRGASAELPLRLKVDGMRAGTYVGQVHLRCKAARLPPGVVNVPVHLTLEAPGPVPSLTRDSCDAGDVYIGALVVATVDVLNIGTGVLNGRFVAADGTVASESFLVEAGETPATVRVSVAGPARAPSEPQNAAAYLFVETDSVVAGARRLPITIRYRTVAMRLTPAAVSFDPLTVGATAQQTVEARYGSGTAIDTLTLAEPIPSWLEVEVTAGGTITVNLRGDRWPGGDEKVKQSLRLKDPATDAIGTLEVSAEFMTPRLAVEPAALDFGQIARGKFKRLPLLLRNDGKGDLVLRELVLDHRWLSVEVDPKAKGAKTELHVRVNASAEMKAGHHRGLIEIVSNDPARSTINIPVSVRVT